MINHGRYGPAERKQGVESSELEIFTMVSDETNFTLALDHFMEDMMYPFSPEFNLLHLDEPLKLSDMAAMTDGVIASASEWIDRERRQHKKGLL